MNKMNSGTEEVTEPNAQPLATPTPEDVGRDVAILEAWLCHGLDPTNGREAALSRLRDGAARAKVLEQQRDADLSAICKHIGWPYESRPDASTAPGRAVCEIIGRMHTAEADLAAARQEAESLKAARESAMSLVDALHVPAGRDLMQAWGRACLMLGRNDWGSTEPTVIASLRARVATLEREKEAGREERDQLHQGLRLAESRAESAESREAETRKELEKVKRRERQRMSQVSQLQDTVQRLKEGTPEAPSATAKGVESHSLGPAATCSYCSPDAPCGPHSPGLSMETPRHSQNENRAQNSGWPPSTPPAPAPLVEAGHVVDVAQAGILRSTGDLPGEVAERVCSATADSIRAYFARRAAHDAAKGGETVDKATITNVLNRLYAASKADDSWRGAIAQAARFLYVQIDRTAAAEHCQHSEAYWDASEDCGSCGAECDAPEEGEPVITHAALAAVVETYAEQRENGGNDFDYAQAEGAREVLRRATGGQAPEVLLASRVVEVMAAAKEMARARYVFGQDGAAYALGVVVGVIDRVARELGLTLDTPPSGPGGGEHDAEPILACRNCEWQTTQRHNAALHRRYFGHVVEPRDPAQSAASHHGGPEGQPREAPVESAPEGPEFAAPDVVYEDDTVRVVVTDDEVATLKPDGAGWKRAGKDTGDKWWRSVLEDVARALAGAKRERQEFAVTAARALERAAKEAHRLGRKETWEEAARMAQNIRLNNLAAVFRAADVDS